jgi:hypothetical protein
MPHFIHTYQYDETKMAESDVGDKSDYFTLLRESKTIQNPRRLLVDKVD